MLFLDDDLSLMAFFTKIMRSAFLPNRLECLDCFQRDFGADKPLRRKKCPTRTENISVACLELWTSSPHTHTAFIIFLDRRKSVKSECIWSKSFITFIAMSKFWLSSPCAAFCWSLLSGLWCWNFFPTSYTRYLIQKIILNVFKELFDFAIVTKSHSPSPSLSSSKSCHPTVPEWSTSCKATTGWFVFTCSRWPIPTDYRPRLIRKFD